jgi:8-oxo-dGTP pyrophosphatase MutT (NUDIX family)
MPAFRELVRRSVSERVAIDHAERRSIEIFLAEYDRLIDPFLEEADLVHVTGSAIVIGERGVVLLKHKRLGLWLQPGGHVDAGETPWDGALREAEEETGLDLAFVDFDDVLGVPRLAHVDVHEAARGHTHLDLRYVLRGGETDPSPPAGESQEIGWFGWDEAIEKASDDRLKSALASLRT